MDDQNEELRAKIEQAFLDLRTVRDLHMIIHMYDCPTYPVDPEEYQTPLWVIPIVHVPVKHRISFSKLPDSKGGGTVVREFCFSIQSEHPIHDTTIAGVDLPQDYDEALTLCVKVMVGQFMQLDETSGTVSAIVLSNLSVEISNYSAEDHLIRMTYDLEYIYYNEQCQVDVFKTLPDDVKDMNPYIVVSRIPRNLHAAPLPDSLHAREAHLQHHVPPLPAVSVSEPT